jgi:hypothetical protein
MTTITKRFSGLALLLMVAIGTSISAFASVSGSCCPGDCCDQSCCKTAHK